ncbi:hydrolase TatD [bacterium]|nr:hydrolase TatD [bacterium]|tara:strand:- start:15774 stop:16571 length:798 start_codon:yes stop_codon:yes gene_type:complete
MKYIDTHSHLYERKFKEDLADVLQRMEDKDVSAIVIGVSLETSKQAVELARNNKRVVGATIGVHPTDTNEKFEAVDYAPLLGEQVVGVGECGFDYYRSPKEDVYVHQREVFEAQVVFASENDLPLMLHVRPSKGSVDAHEDALEVLKIYQKEYGNTVRGNVHFYTSTKEIAREYVSLGFTIAFPGVITFAPDLHDVVRDVPLDMMLAETDAPYAAPVPHRGKRNEPIFVIDTIKAIADIRGEDFEQVAEQLTKNAKTVFLSDKSA